MADTPPTDTPADTPADGDAAEQEAVTTRHGVVVETVGGIDVLHPTRDQYVDLVRTLCDEGFRFCSDLTAVDYLTHPGRHVPDGVEPGRFEVVVSLLSHEHRQRVRIRVQVPADDPAVPTLWELHPGTDVLEREVYDMFGIRFDGHPDLTRILMPEDWDGHPLRKDYPVGRIPVEFKEAPGAR